MSVNYYYPVFKAGDKVKCINNKYMVNDRLEIGRIYEVKFFDPNIWKPIGGVLVYFQGAYQGFYYADRFVKEGEMLKYEKQGTIEQLKREVKILQKEITKLGVGK